MCKVAADVGSGSGDGRARRVRLIPQRAAGSRRSEGESTERTRAKADQDWIANAGRRAQQKRTAPFSESGKCGVRRAIERQRTSRAGGGERRTQQKISSPQSKDESAAKRGSEGGNFEWKLSGRSRAGSARGCRGACWRAASVDCASASKVSAHTDDAALRRRRARPRSPAPAAPERPSAGSSRTCAAQTRFGMCSTRGEEDGT